MEGMSRLFLLPFENLRGDGQTPSVGVFILHLQGLLETGQLGWEGGVDVLVMLPEATSGGLGDAASLPRIFCFEEEELGEYGSMK